MGPLCALWVVLLLLGALKGRSPLPTNPINTVTVPVLRSFEVDKFQGMWFVLGLAGSTHSKADRSVLSPFTAMVEQNSQGQLEVSYAMLRAHRCITWSYTLIPTAQPGKFSRNISRELGADTEEVQVHDTNYISFALMSSTRVSRSQRILRVHLLFRVWEIQMQMLENFTCLIKALGMSSKNIVFPDFTDWSPFQKTC